MSQISPVKSIRLFDRKYNRINGIDNRRLPVYKKASLINEALEIFYENRVDRAETNSKVRNEIRVLEEKHVPLKRIKNTSKFDVYRIPENLYRTLRYTCEGDKEHCSPKELNVVVAQSDDLNNMRKSPYWKSSYHWEHILMEEGREGYFLWHEGDFRVVKLMIDYFRKPRQFKCASQAEEGRYEDDNGEIVTSDAGIELTNAYQHRIIIDIAVLMAKAELADVRDYELQLAKLLNVEKI